MLEKWPVSYPAHTGREMRSVYVYVPDSFEADESLRYPVLYMFDGHNVFLDSDASYGKSWGMKEWMDRSKTQMIIVGVECNRSPDHGRLSEYSPFSFRFRSAGWITGRGEQTMHWFVRTLKPMIDKLYPTLKDQKHTYIAGSSMGGLMSLYAVLHYNHVFSRAAALSPSVWVSPRELAQLIQDSRISPNTHLYMDYGSEELRNHRGMERTFAACVSRLMQKRLLVTARIIPGGTHCEASWEKQIPFFMKTLLYEPDETEA